MSMLLNKSNIISLIPRIRLKKLIWNHLHKENPPVKWGIILQLLTINISVGPPGFEPGTYAL